MLLHIIARGRIGTSAEGALTQRYLGRISWPTRLTELPESGGKWPDPTEKSTRLVLLDERGKDLTSRDLAAQLARWRDDGVREVRFALGGADGFTADQRGRADLLLCFGRLTWPHLLARAMLAEQLYRAVSIIAGHPYHRDGAA